MRAVVLAALCSGCFNPAVSAGSACDTECPGALVCIDGVCREPGFMPPVDAALTDAPAVVPDAPPLDAPPGDGDGDGVTDDVDNCSARPNADQHDEDADGRGDVCDPCPHLAGDAADGDGDGVGDACDPQPQVAKQQLRFFDPFTSNKSEWQHGGGTTRLGETLRMNANTSASTRLVIANAETRIATAGTIVSVAAATPHQLSLAFGFNATNSIYHYVQFYDTGGATGSISIFRDNAGTFSSLASTSYIGTLPTGAFALQVDSSVDTQQIRLAAKVGGMSYPALMGTATTPPLTASGHFTLFARNADIRMDYVIVIDTLP